MIGYEADRLIGGPREYLPEHFNALRDFYLDAAGRHLLVVLWWDRPGPCRGVPATSTWGTV
ncbi:hypothetical protein AB0A94_15695 [Streptomyces sp. NPDC044984]|uniref:hypothetical protein n=1 Tax=Streptomyces sp. NPDC044984 TaxID=3154335 RepID=UPI0033DEF697